MSAEQSVEFTGIDFAARAASLRTSRAPAEELKLLLTEVARSGFRAGVDAAVSRMEKELPRLLADERARGLAAGRKEIVGRIAARIARVGCQA